MSGQSKMSLDDNEILDTGCMKKEVKSLHEYRLEIFLLSGKSNVDHCLLSRFKRKL